MNPSGGWFEVSGQSARLRLEPGGWLVGTAPTERDGASLLREQSNFEAPVKAMDSGHLRAEVPYCDDLGSRFLVVHDALERSLRRLDGLATTAQRRVAEPRLFDWLESSGYGLEEDNHGWIVTLKNDGHRPQTARIETVGDVWSARAELVRLRAPAPASIEALEHFLLALNGRLRFARGSLLRGAVMLEVVYPVGSLSLDVVEKAFGAVAVGIEWAHRECRALSEPALAKRYLKFHQHI